MLYRAIDRCRACGSSNIPSVLDLGMFALSDFLDSPDAHTDRAPLEWLRCEDCTLVQLAHTVDRDRLYRRYWYRSGTNESMVQALRSVAAEAQARVRLRPGDVVLDIGANDGTLLRSYPEGLIRYAYEPAENLWPALQMGSTSRDPDRGITVAGSFFPSMAGGRPVGMEPGAKVITSIACFYDVDDPGAFVEGIKANLAEDGVWINQMAYLPDTLNSNNFGDICHEHLTYWTIQSFSSLLGDHGLHLNDYSFNDVNGGSVRTIVSRTPVVKHRMDAPSADDIDAFRRRFFWEAAAVDNTIVHALNHRKTVVGYGASTKGNTCLQYWGMRPDTLQYIADRNPEKWGKFTPTGQQVISEAEMRAMKPDYLLVLPFHFLDTFVDRERALLESGTKLIVPFPKLRLIGGDHADVQPKESPPESGPELHRHQVVHR